MDPEMLCCPHCRGSLRAASAGYSCCQCQATYPVRHGVPILIPGITVERSNFSVADDLITRICAAETIPDQPENRATLREIFAWNYRLADIWLTAENNYYLKRVGLNADGYRPKAPRMDRESVNGNICYEIPFHYIPATLPPGETRSWNVRLVNKGAGVLSPEGSQPVFLCYRWRDPTGTITQSEEVRTTLPVEMEPGRGVTIPLWVATPGRPGQYTLEVLLGQDGPIWHEGGARRIDVQVSASWNSAVLADWLTLHRLPETYDYRIDHEVGRVFVKEELARRRQPLRHVLEVGGCCNPMTWDLPGELVSTDIDVQTLQVGALHFATTKPNIKFVAADALKQPFADGVFDCAVLFSTLHHLLDPVGCLREMRRVVRPGGFLAILCEPIGSYRAETLSAEFRRDLEEGINEQIFTDEEYAQMFDAAGLVATRAVIDGGSFKAILSRDGAVCSIDTTSSAPTRRPHMRTQLSHAGQEPLNIRFARRLTSPSAVPGQSAQPNRGTEMTDTTSELQKKINEMIWFHTIDFGNGVISPGTKSMLQLRREADAFFGCIDLRGRTFLDIGAWNGYFSFEAKSRGAGRVLATDKFTWTHPHLKGREGFELARKHLGYSIEAEEIDVAELTVERVGTFEVVLFAGVFCHLFEAPQLMQQAAHTATKLFIVETHQELIDLERPAMVYYPGATLANDETNFWGPNPPLMRQLLTESGFNEIHYRPHPDTEHDHIRGIYLAFRDVESMTSLSFDRAGRWRDLNRQPSTISYGEHVATSLPTIPICEAEGHYCYGDGVSGWLTVLAFETDLRVSGCAPFSISVTNDGIRVWPSVRLVLRWTGKEPDGGELILSDQIAAELSLLAPGKSQVLETSVPVPVNSVRDLDIAFHLMAADGTYWLPKDLPALLRRHISGQSAENVPADFDYEAMYRTVDLQQDWWTPVGPATRAEYESLGRAQCESLVALGLGPNARVLDIGCGTGRLTEALAPILSPEGLYYGTDVAEEAVQFCRAKFPQSRFHFVKNEHTSIPIYGIDFDFICLSSVFTHMFPADIAVMLVDIRRLMADSGCVVADAFVSPAIADFVGNRAMIQLNESNLLAEFRKHGFRVRELSSTTWNEQCRRVIYHLTAQESR